MGRIAKLQPVRPIFLTGLASHPMGSSGMKRKGRKHQPKVGTKQEREYALQQDQRAVAANFGISGKGAMFWIAIVVIVALVAVAVLSLALFF
jgi:anti-sigma-K factor RskA